MLQNLQAHLLIGLTSVAPRTTFAAASPTLVATKPTRAVVTLIYISLGSTLVRARPGSSPIAVDPKS